MEKSTDKKKRLKEILMTVGCYLAAVLLIAGVMVIVSGWNETESAKDGVVDFKKLQENNPEIFAWLYIPGTNIDYPILQSAVDDGYYVNHSSDGKESETGSLYTEMANMMNMGDFNTVVHGQSSEDEDMFAQLPLYKEEDFFERNSVVQVFLPDNKLTYVIFAAYSREDDSLLRSYNFTDYLDCGRFLRDIYGAADHVREGFEEITPYHYLLTLTTKDRDNEGMQYNVTAVLVRDEAGTIERTVLTY